MQDLINLNMRILRLGLDIIQLQQQAWTTILLRQPIIFGDDHSSRRESVRMVAEKAQAGAESTFALLGACTSLWRYPSAPVSSAKVWLRLAETGLRPYRRKVVANSRRLTRHH